VAISGCTIQHTQNTAGSANIRYLGEDARHRRWGNLVITGNVLSDARINVDIRKARGVSIVGNTFWAGADRHLQALQSSHVVVGPNLMDRNPGYASEGDTDDGVLLADCCDCTLSGLHLSGVRRAEAGLVLDKCRRISVTGCTILDCQKAGILLRDCHQCRVANCFVSNDLPNEEPFEAIGQVGGAGNRVEP
jgi:parallel beta-helix repeat protein